MKTNLALPQNVCSRPALAASTLSTPVSASNQHRLPSLIFDSLGPQARSPRAIRITQRDQSIIDLIFRLRALRDDARLDELVHIADFHARLLAETIAEAGEAAILIEAEPR